MNIFNLKRGFITLGLLMLLSGILLLLLWIDDDNLSFHSGLAAQRQISIQQNMELQQQWQQQRENLCQQLELSAVENIKSLAISSPKIEDYQHFIWCKKLMLFKKIPKSKLNQGAFEDFIATELQPTFQAQISEAQRIQYDQPYYLIWFGAQQNHWQLDGDINAVLLAEGDLTLSGKGKIKGAVIIGGEFNLPNSITLSYNKYVVNDVVRMTSRWQLQEDSWHDFIPNLERQ